MISCSHWGMFDDEEPYKPTEADLKLREEIARSFLRTESFAPYVSQDLASELSRLDVVTEIKPIRYVRWPRDPRWSQTPMPREVEIELKERALQASMRSPDV